MGKVSTTSPPPAVSDSEKLLLDIQQLQAQLDAMGTPIKLFKADGSPDLAAMERVLKDKDFSEFRVSNPDAVSAIEGAYKGAEKIMRIDGRAPKMQTILGLAQLAEGKEISPIRPTSPVRNLSGDVSIGLGEALGRLRGGTDSQERASLRRDAESDAAAASRDAIAASGGQGAGAAAMMAINREAIARRARMAQAKLNMDAQNAGFSDYAQMLNMRRAELDNQMNDRTQRALMQERMYGIDRADRAALINAGIQNISQGAAAASRVQAANIAAKMPAVIDSVNSNATDPSMLSMLPIPTPGASTPMPTSGYPSVFTPWDEIDPSLPIGWAIDPVSKKFIRNSKIR